MRSHRGTLILILGILSLVFCGIFTGIPAWVMGNADLKDMDAGTMDPAGRGATNAGRILGIISVVFAALTILAVLGLFALGIIGAAASHH